MASLGYRLADATLGAMMMSYDADRTGNLGFDEYLQAMSELTLFTNLFRTHDTTSTGGKEGAHAGRAMPSFACCHARSQQLASMRPPSSRRPPLPLAVVTISYEQFLGMVLSARVI